MTLIEFINSTINSNVQIKKTCRHKTTQVYTEFVSLCKKEKNNIYLDESLTLTESMYLILNNESFRRKCYCGADLTFYNMKKGYSTYCSVQCRSNDPAFAKTLSAAKSAQYNDPEQKAAIEAKKIATNMANLGVAHPMQNVESFEKQAQACFKSHKMHKGLLLQGFEPVCFDYLNQFYAEDEILRGTDYMKDNQIVIDWVDNDKKQRYSYPDFFIPSTNTFIEVKSEYTMQQGRYKIKRCQERLEELGFGYEVIVYTPPSHNKTKLHSFYIVQHNTHHMHDPD